MSAPGDGERAARGATDGGESVGGGPTGAGAADTGGSSVQETLNDIYGGRRDINPWYVLVALGVAVGWWQLLGAFSAFVAGMGLVLLVTGIDNAATAVASRRWPTTEGVVLESTVLTQRELRDSFDGIARRASATGGYVPLVRYQYTVDGQQHVNVRISPFDGRLRRRRRAESVVEDYPRNEQVTVRYDPADPSRSFLRLWTWASWFFVWVLGSVAFLGVALLIAFGPSLVSRITIDVPDFLPFVLFGGLFVAFGLYQFLGGLLTYRWPSTTGVVRGREISRSSGSENTSTSYVPKLRYEYTVDGDTYVSSRMSAGSGPSFRSRSGAESWLEDYPMDGEVTVYYSPRRPDRSVIVRGGALQGLVLVVIVGLMLTVLFFLVTGRPLPDWLPIDRLLDQLPS